MQLVDGSHNGQQDAPITEDIALLTDTPSDSLIHFDKLIKPGDRILFLGDELDQKGDRESNRTF